MPDVVSIVAAHFHIRVDEIVVIDPKKPVDPWYSLGLRDEWVIVDKSQVKEPKVLDRVPRSQASSEVEALYVLAKRLKLVP
jgi:hypothetical protein